MNKTDDLPIEGGWMNMDSVALAQKLIQFPSLNPPGEEKACIEYLANLLSEGGLDVAMFEFAPNRPSLIAKIVGSGSEKPVCFTGHVDVVPLGAEVWKLLLSQETFEMASCSVEERAT